MKKSFLPVIVSGIVILAACSKKNTATKTVKVVPTTYDAHVLPLIQAKCSPCHLPAKGGRKASFENYEAAKKYGTEMLVRVQKNNTERGFMPFKNQKLSEEEIVTIKKWIDQGLPEK